MNTKTILISGAGVAGPALAFWLHRYGFKATIIERAPGTRPGGYAVDFRGAGLDILEKMDILDEIRKFEMRTGSITIVDKNNKTISHMPDGFTSGELEILRGDLTNILYDATKQDIEYIFDDTITALTQGPNSVEVTFEHAPARQFDLVIGADGLHSNVRRITFGDEAKFRQDMGLYIAVFTTTNYMNIGANGVFYTTPGKRVGFFGAKDNTEAMVSFYFKSEPLEYDRKNVAQQQQILRSQFAQEEWEVPYLLELMEQSRDFYFDSISQIKMDRWSTGRIALLGDAAHCASPLSGMGTSMAVIGAYILAGELKKADGDYTTAFQCYESTMRDFVTRGQKLADGGVEWFVPATRFKHWLSQQMWKMLPYSPWKNMMLELPSKIARSITPAHY